MSEGGLQSMAITGVGVGAKRKNRSKQLFSTKLPLVSAQQALDCLEDKFCSRYKRVKDAFVMMDYDCDGKISKSEFRVTLDLMGLVMTDSEYVTLWKYFDANGSGFIDYTEFNNKVGALIHPPITRNIIDRPRTPRVRNANARKMAVAIRKTISNLDQAFRMIDSDGSGFISHAEFIQALRHVGMSKVSHEESYNMMMKFKEKDDPNPGLSFDQFKLTMDEYLKVPEVEKAAEEASKHDYLPILSLVHAEKLLCEKLWGKFAAVQRAFRLFDEDKSGDLSYDEFRAALRSLGVNLTEPDFRELMGKYDTNGDGSISYDEFNAQVGSLIHPDAVNTRMKDMEEKSGAQEDALHFNPNKMLGGHRPSAAEKGARTLEEKAALLAPRLGLCVGEALLAYNLYGRYHDLQKAFRDFDVDYSGKLSSTELRGMLRELHVRLTDDAFEELIMKYDRDGDGGVSYDELNALLSPLLMENPGTAELLGISDARDRLITLHNENGEDGEMGEAETAVEETKDGSSVDARPTVPKLSLAGSVGGSKMSVASSARSVATRDIDLVSTESKMRKILGKSWLGAYKSMKKKEQKDGSDGLTTGRFRDAMAERGVPLTSKEVRALALKYSARGAKSSRGSNLDYGKLMKHACSGRGSGRSSARGSARDALAGGTSARLSSRRSTVAEEMGQ